MGTFVYAHSVLRKANHVESDTSHGYSASVQHQHSSGVSSSPNINTEAKKPQCWDHGCEGRQFSTSSNLLRHQREKSGSSTKQVCTSCGVEFTRKSALEAHSAHEKCFAKVENNAERSTTGHSMNDGNKEPEGRKVDINDAYQVAYTSRETLHHMQYDLPQINIESTAIAQQPANEVISFQADLDALSPPDRSEHQYIVNMYVH